ncbi:MAG: ATP-binding protein [Chloroflexota bacterium]
MSESPALPPTIFERLRRAFQRRPSRISQSLTASVALIVALTVLFGALPAFGAMQLQLNYQVELRIQEAQLSTQALYEAESERLAGLARLISERPTLCNLVLADDLQALQPYLDTLRKDTSIDALFLVRHRQPVVVDGMAGLPSPDALRGGRALPYVDLVVQESPPRLLVVAANPLQAERCASGAGDWMLAVQVLDDEEMRGMAQDTGLEQSLIVNGQRVATSLSFAPDWPLNPDAAEQVRRTLSSCCVRGADQAVEYYLGLAPLLDSQGELVGISEVALPAKPISQGIFNSAALLLGGSLLVAGLGILAAMRRTHRILRPLSSLAEAAENLRKGDWETPLPEQSDWVEINQLAEQLADSRRYIQQMLQITQREMSQVTHLLGALREGVVTLDQDGLITWLNPDAERILGRRAVEMLRSPYSRVFRPAPGEAQTLKDILEPLPGRPPVRRLAVLDGNDRPLTLAVSTSWMEASDAPAGPGERVLVFRDVSEEAAYNRLRAEFLANMAHEFRTPSSSIAASIELLAEEGDSMSSEELMELANTTRISTQHLQALLDNLLESATIEAGCFRLRCRPIALHQVIRDTAALMSPLLRRRQQALELELPQELPTLWADPSRLSQVLVNLLENASKFTPFGAVIQLVVEQREADLVISVLDNGPGLPAGRYSDLFKRYFTAHELRGAQYGVGLGLSVVKTIVEAHGGRVGAENRSAGGARVWFSLPLESPADNEA